MLKILQITIATILLMESIDWNSCIICKTEGDLRCSVDSHVDNGIEVYSSFLEAVENFCKFNAMPVDIK